MADQLLQQAQDIFEGQIVSITISMKESATNQSTNTGF